MSILETGKRLADAGLLGKPWTCTPNRREWVIGRLKILLTHKSPNSFMGRFGGGWNWKFGVQVGGSTAIFSLLVADLSVTIGKKKEGQ